MGVIILSFVYTTPDSPCVHRQIFHYGTALNGLVFTLVIDLVYFITKNNLVILNCRRKKSDDCFIRLNYWQFNKRNHKIIRDTIVNKNCEKKEKLWQIIKLIKIYLINK